MTGVPHLPEEGLQRHRRESSEGPFAKCVIPRLYIPQNEGTEGRRASHCQSRGRW